MVAVTLPTELRLGPLRVGTPVVLAPMAGVTNAAFRRLCREQGAGLYVCEMITSRGIVERDETTLRMLRFDETEDIRSVQLYGTDPVYVGKATEILCAEHGVRARRPQLRLPGARRSPARAAAARCPGSAGCSARSSSTPSGRPSGTTYPSR